VIKISFIANIVFQKRCTPTFLFILLSFSFTSVIFLGVHARKAVLGVCE